MSKAMLLDPLGKDFIVSKCTLLHKLENIYLNKEYVPFSNSSNLRNQYFCFDEGLLALFATTQRGFLSL